MGRIERDPERAPDTELAIAAVVDFPFFISFFFVLFFSNIYCALFSQSSSFVFVNFEYGLGQRSVSNEGCNIA